MDKDPSLEAEKEDPIDDFEDSFGVGPVDSDDDNELNSTNFVGERWAPHSPEENDAVLDGSNGGFNRNFHFHGTKTGNE